MARYIFPAGSVTSTGTRQHLAPYLSTTDETPETEIAYVRGATETGKGRQSIVTDESGAYTAFVGPEGASTLLLERPNGTRVAVTSSTATTDTTPAGASASALAADPAFTGTYAPLAATSAALAALPGIYAAAALPAHAVAAGATRRYNPQQCLYGASAANLRVLRAAYASAVAGVGMCRIACLGDSTTAGTGTGLVKGTTDYPARLRQQLAAGGYRVSTGVVVASQATGQADARWAFTGTWADAVSYRQSGASGSSATFTGNVAGTIVDIYITAANGVHFTYSIDGGAAVDVVISNQNIVNVVSVTGLTDTTHTVTITQSTGSVILLYGCEVRATYGISVSNLGVPGAGSATWAPSYGANFLGRAINPHGVIINLGINDYFTSTATTLLKSAQTTLVGEYPAASVVLTVPNPTTAVYTPSWATYATALYQLSDTLSLPLLDITERWGSAALAAGLLSVDGTHPNVAGYVDIASAWFRFISGS